MQLQIYSQFHSQPFKYGGGFTRAVPYTLAVNCEPYNWDVGRRLLIEARQRALARPASLSASLGAIS